MAQASEDMAHQIVEHVRAVLQADLPVDLRAIVQVRDYTPGLLSQLPFVTISADVLNTQATSLGHTVALKRGTVDGAPSDLGYVTGDTVACRFTLTLWALTQPYLARLRGAVLGIAWVRRERAWEMPAGTLNRVTLLRCRLGASLPATVALLSPAPPHITVRADLLNLRSGPSTGFAVVGQGRRGEQFELLGRNEDATWVQGSWRAGQPVWMSVFAGGAGNLLDVSVPLSLVPQAEDIPAPVGPAGPEGGAPGADVEPLSEPVTAWSQALSFEGTLECTQEPVSAGGRIQEIDVTRHLQGEETVLDTERIRRLADHEDIVEKFPS